MTIKEICQKYGLGQSALARRFGIPLRTLQHWYLGERQPPDYVVAMMEQILSEKISVETPLGRLEACIGGDRQDYPGIFTYIVRSDGVEIDLVACEVKVEEDIAQAYLYGDTETDQWTRSHQWTKDAILSE